jgi:hypothetical protein
MKSFIIFLVISTKHCFVLSFFLQMANETERMRRSVEGMEQIFFRSYNERVESKKRRKFK